MDARQPEWFIDGERVDEKTWQSHKSRMEFAKQISLSIEEVEQFSGEKVPEMVTSILNEDGWFDRSQVKSYTDEQRSLIDFSDPSHPDYMFIIYNTEPVFFPKFWKGFEAGRSIIDYQARKPDGGPIFYVRTTLFPLYGTNLMCRHHMMRYVIPPYQGPYEVVETRLEDHFECNELRKASDEEAARLSEGLINQLPYPLFYMNTIL